MALITLTTDWHMSDFFRGAVIGRIQTLCPGAMVVDLAAGLNPFDVKEAAFVMKHSFRHYPKGTMHLCGVQSEVRAKPLLVIDEEQYFLLPDNGMVGMIFPEGPEKVFRLTTVQENSTFPLLEQMVPAACELLNGKSPGEIGLPENKMKKFKPLTPTVEEDRITGLVIHIDSYQNLVTNITRELFEQVGKGRNFEIYPGRAGEMYRITRISEHYLEMADTDMFALFNSLGLLEIGMVHAQAAKLMNVLPEDPIQITFSS